MLTRKGLNARVYGAYWMPWWYAYEDWGTSAVCTVATIMLREIMRGR